MQNDQRLDGIEGTKEETVITEFKKALIVSVSDYTSSLQTLDFCKTDGQDTYQLLKSFKIADSHKLIGHVTYETMREAIIDFFTDVNNKAEDTLLFYYSGHGIPDVDGDIYLASSEIDPDAPYRRGFSFNELTKMIQRSVSIRIVTVLDCCYSGAAKLSKGHEEDAAKLGTVTIDSKANVLQQGEGKCLLAASQAAQEAYALKEGDHSIFTYYFLQGLRGTEKSVDSDGNITPYSLGNFIYRSILNLPPIKRPKQKPITKVEASGDIILASYPNLSKSKPVSSPILRTEFQPESQAPLQHTRQEEQAFDTSSPLRVPSTSSPISYRPSAPKKDEYGSYYRHPEEEPKEQLRKTSILSPKTLIPIVGIGVIVIAAVLVFTLFGSINQTPEQDASTPSTPPSLSAPTATPGMINESNQETSAPTKLTHTITNDQISFQYPISWESRDVAASLMPPGTVFAVRLLPPGQDDTADFIDNVVVSIAESYMNLDEYTSEVLNDYGKVSSVTILTSEPTTLAGNPAHQIEYRETVRDVQTKKMQVWTIVENQIYIVTYAADESEYPLYLPGVETIVNSLQIKAQPTGSSST